jgi:16S rRNA (cytidine1402-2'-O)-methyltransferase
MGKKGVLVVVGTPLGNLGDMAPRAVEALQAAEVIACEDTRRCGQLLRLLGLKAPKLVSFHKDNERGRLDEVVKLLRGGAQVALASDGGMPGISDPGAVLVAAARAAGVAVEIVPGPTAITTAVAGSGFEGGFVFGGFVERKAGAKKAQLQALAALPLTLVFYESPQRVAATVADFTALLGNRRAWLARELTKLHEEWIGPDLQAIGAELARRGDVKGECVLVVEGHSGAADEGAVSVDDEDIAARLEAGDSVKDVAAWVAEVEGVSKKEAYARVQGLKG